MEHIQRAFEKIGAQAKIRRDHADEPDAPWVRVNVLRDRGGREFFDILLSARAQPEVIDARPALRHLVLMVRTWQKAKYLCGHDERHWFCAAVPGRAVSTVETAIRSLRPEATMGAGMRRQGEWFFRALTPTEMRALIGDKPVVYSREPISRGNGSKPHVCQQVVRAGGVPVWVCSSYPSGITQAEYQALIHKTPDAVKWNWRAMTRDARVFARGAVRHSDHATIHLWDWHEVYLNNERLAPHARSVAFLD